MLGQSLTHPGEGEKWGKGAWGDGRVLNPSLTTKIVFSASMSCRYKKSPFGFSRHNWETYFGEGYIVLTRG